jgi:SAM-dependent methyltransferase
MQERDYVLGTHDSEVERLGLQHRVWQSTVLECWRRAGITTGSRVLDLGAGPGYATLDLAELVGASGEVIAIERSNRFVDFGKAACTKRGLHHVRWFELDLMTEPLPAKDMDAAWCRWVASFVSRPEMLVAKIAQAIRPGGVAIFHEYVDYDTFRLVPPGPAVEQFKQHVAASWRANGGEPDVARQLPTLLAANGFKIRSAAPKIFCARPGEELWSWPASWMKINSRRLQELKQVDEAWVRALDQELAAAEANPNSLLLTPMVLEIIAEKVN